MKKILFAAMAAIIVCGMFAGFRYVNSAITNGMAMNPTEKVVNPPDGGPLYFLYEINITTTVTDVSAWEATLLWDPNVLRAVDVVWGSFMTGGDLMNSTFIASSGLLIILGQSFTSEVTTVTGSGTLASVNFTFVLPGATFVRFLEAKVWDNALAESDLLLGSVDGRVKSDRPHPAFSWTTDDGLYGALPNKTIYDGGRTPYFGNVVNFNASTKTYDVSNMVWNGTAYNLVGGANIVALRWEYGDGAWDYYTTAGPTPNFTWTTSHVYTAYIKAGWLVNLTAWDAAADYWSSTWRYQGSYVGDTVPMWRDVAVLDIWPSLIPYQNWDAYDDEWYAYWWYDSTDFWLPHTADPYWNYNMSGLYQYYYELVPGVNSTVKQAWDVLGNSPSVDYGDEGPGLNIVVTANNFGSVPEKVTVNLYAIGIADKTTAKSPNYDPVRIASVEQIGSWKKTLAAGAGSGWGCTVNWLPSLNATYVLLATIDSQDGAVIYDGDRANNYYALSTPVSNLEAWNMTSLAMVPPGWINNIYLCDFTSPTGGSDGKVGSPDLNFLLTNFGSNAKAFPYQAPITKP